MRRIIQAAVATLCTTGVAPPAFAHAHLRARRVHHLLISSPYP